MASLKRRLRAGEPGPAAANFAAVPREVFGARQQVRAVRVAEPPAFEFKKPFPDAGAAVQGAGDEQGAILRNADCSPVQFLVVHGTEGQAVLDNAGADRLVPPDGLFSLWGEADGRWLHLASGLDEVRTHH